MIVRALPARSAAASSALLRGSPELRNGQAQLLEMVATGAPLRATLDALMLLIEAQSDGLFCSVLLLDEDGEHIHPGAGPNMPADYMAALDGLPIGPMAGSCGTAMYRRETVVVTDVLSDPLWAPYTAVIEPYGFRACWSTPIFLRDEEVLGSFAMYYKEVRSPGPFELDLIAVATNLAGIAIERTRRADQLDRYHHHLEQLVVQRTAELTAAKDKAEAGVAALRAAQEELVRSQKLAALGALVAGVAHELNTPIGNSIVTVSALGDQGRALAERYAAAGGIRRSELEDFLSSTEEAADLLLRNLTRAARLIDTFKQVAVERAGSPRRRVSLLTVVQEAAVAVRAALERRGARLAIDVAPEIELESYPDRLGHAISNVLDNTVQHAFPGKPDGVVTVSAGVRGDAVELAVADNGVGIAPEHLGRVFDPFFTTRLGSGNCGLGLNVAHNITTALLGGTLSAAPTPGGGARFVFLLPLTAPE
ncbi:MAG TPA: ATP-binding protein [Telluria sp.]|nr:ATP-binding protein [Telluria sp.]